MAGNEERTIIRIPRKESSQQNGRKRLLRVAAYCRVSTEQEEQESSFENQVDYYTRLINGNPEWKMAGIYADHGISGVRDMIRPGFMNMIEDCKKHKIDLIMTKSLSRFSRNTLDCIKYIRLLKGLGVAIEFEKEGLNTGELSSEIFLTWFSAFAQAESESLSQNITMGKRRLIQAGKAAFPYHSFLGYRPGPDGRPEIDPEQAKTVKRIFYGYLAGKTPSQLKAELEQDHVLSPAGKAEWSRATIQNMLHNEKYVGDLLLQKTYTADFLTKTVKKNRGEVEQCYVRNNHPAIIPRDIFQAVQLEMARRGSKTKINPNKGISGRSKYSGKFALTERLICGECGCMYRRVLYTNRDGSKARVWRCTNRLENGKRFCKNSPTLKEQELHTALMKCIAALLDNKESVKEEVMQTEENILRYEGAAQDSRQLLDLIQEIDHQTSNLLLLVAHSEDASIYEGKFKALKEEKQALQTELERLQRTSQMDAEAQNRIQKVWDCIQNAPTDFTQYDDDLVRRIVEQVIVYSQEKVVVKFVGGYSVEMVTEN